MAVTKKKVSLRPGFDENIISGVIPHVEKVRHYLFLKGTWNATLTTENKIYIEAIKGQMIDKAKWEILKGMCKLPEDLFNDLETYFNADWSKLK